MRGISTARAYHIYTGALYIFGIVAVYWLVRLGSNSRARALLAALATLLISPAQLLVADLRQSNPYWIPMRLEVLTHYGEGPHISALCLLPAALGGHVCCINEARPIGVAAAAVLCALTVANNFYGATALAILFPVVVWSVWVGFRDRRIWLYSAGIIALAYGLSAFWLTPSYLRVTGANLRLVAQPGTVWARLVALIALALYCGLSFKLGNRRPERIWKVFVAGVVTLLGVYVLGFYYFRLIILGQPHRLVPELDLALSLLLAELVCLLWTRRNLRAFTIAATCFVFMPATSYFGPHSLALSPGRPIGRPIRISDGEMGARASAGPAGPPLRQCQVLVRCLVRQRANRRRIRAGNAELDLARRHLADLHGRPG